MAAIDRKEELMTVVKEEITKEKFEKLSKLTGKEFESELKIPIEWYCGYGYYGTALRQEGDKYFAIHNIGSTCD